MTAVAATAEKAARVVTIHQPDFLPWLGFFDRWKNSDLFIVLDNVQFLRQGWHNRDKIKIPGGVRWLSVPTIRKGKFEQEIRDVLIDYQHDWPRKFLETIRHAYGKAPNFDRIFPDIVSCIKTRHSLLIDLNMNLLRWAADELEINAPMILASTLQADSKATMRLVELTTLVGGEVYFTGTGARDYLEAQYFEAAGIEVRWQEFEHPVYPQLHGRFEAGLSVLDYLMMRPVADEDGAAFP